MTLRARAWRQKATCLPVSKPRSIWPCAPVLVVALTLRVKPWIERTSRVGEVIHAPRIGIEAARLLAAAQADAAVGVVEFDGPAGIAADLCEAGPRLVLADASELFAAVRTIRPAKSWIATQDREGRHP
jgi:hypothetical protein